MSRTQHHVHRIDKRMVQAAEREQRKARRRETKALARDGLIEWKQCPQPIMPKREQWATSFVRGTY